MTGLDPTHNVIVEIATIVTDDDLNIVAEGPDLVINATPEQLDDMDDVVRRMHTASGLLTAIGKSTVTVEYAAAATLEFVKSQLPAAGSVPLCGNSIAMDRRFLRHTCQPLTTTSTIALSTSHFEGALQALVSRSVHGATPEDDSAPRTRRHPREHRRARLLPRAPVPSAGGDEVPRQSLQR